MPLPTSASDVTETIKNAALGNGAVAQATRAATGAPVVKVAATTVVTSRPTSAIASVIKSSAVAKKVGYAPAVSSGSSGPSTPTVSAHTGAKSLITVSGVNYDLYTFLTVGTNTFVVSDGSITADIFLLGGGGAGAAAGGGGGGLLVATNVVIPAGTYTVRVGAGGAIGANKDTKGANGEDSFITINGVLYSGIGGGAGAVWAGSGATGGNNGGNGGGGSHVGNSRGVGSQGFNGADSPGYFGNGGGGGMGGPGSGTSGGPGLASTFSGTSVTYGGGGAGAADSSLCGCAGGSGGGGARMSAGSNGIGGGGGGAYYAGQMPGNGGSGRVMIRVRK